ncbi:MAG: formate dehydrogenase subunit alpha [Betaproteobacteria bacterium]|nr:MAG: formate dehydrogenase subunit alpha [Betaproteobacteria bacterium]
MNSVTLELNGQRVSATSDETLWSVAQREGIEIAHLCHAPGLRPEGNCRACMVEVDGERVLAASCCRNVSEGMKVQTDSPRAKKARAMVMELLLSDAGGATDQLSRNSELSRWARHEGAQSGRFASRASVETDRSHPAIAVDLNACIQCTRCLRACRDEQNNDVIGMALRGAHSKIVFDADASMMQSSCVGCGECVQACPTGALSPAGAVAMTPIAKQVDSVCAFCGVGCQITLNLSDQSGVQRIEFVDGKDGPANHGRLCVKGRYGFDYVHHPDRLLRPLIRRTGVGKDATDIERVKRGEIAIADLFREATWDEALDAAASGLVAARDAAQRDHRNSAIAGFGSAKGSNEEAYLFQKLIRQGFGTNNVDHCTRLCHASSVAALLEGLGSAAVSNPVSDVAHAELIFVIGANPTSNHPVAATWIKNAVRRGAKLVLADPRATPLARFATWHVQFQPDTDVAFLNGLLHVIIAENLVAHSFLEARVNGFEALKRAVSECTPERMAEICGVDATTIREVARAFATSKSAMILWGMGISQHVHGTDNARCLIALSMITGQIGRPGTGLHPLRGQNNVQGASDAGLIPMMYPNYQRVLHDEVRAQFESLWGASLDAKPGLTVVEIMHAIHRGEIRAMFVEGENPAMSDPDLNHAREGLAKLENLVVQDIFATETAILADVILPASTFYEKWGTVTNTDRIIQMGRPALSPPGQAKQDLWIIEQIARRVGLDWDYWQASDGAGSAAAEAPSMRVFEEMRSVMPPLAGASWARIAREDAVVTPADREDAAGQSVVFVEQFPTADGMATMHAASFAAGPEQTDGEFPFILSTGRVLEHWHTGSMTRRATSLDALAPTPKLAISASDAAQLGLTSGESLAVTSRHGTLTAVADVSDLVQRGQVFLPFAYWEAAANKLTGDALDPFGKIPGFKVTAVSVVKVRESQLDLSRNFN